MEDKTDDIIIEILDSSQVPENELVYFEETQPLKVEDIVQHVNQSNSLGNWRKQKQSNEEILIKKYVNGEVAFTDFYNSFDDNDVEEDEDENNDEYNDYNGKSVSTQEEIKENIVKIATTSYYSSTVKDEQSKEQEHEQFIELERKENKRGFRKKSVLNAALQGLMGEANLCFVRGQVGMAEKICLEIIRQNPLASEPFFTLAQIYENKDDDKYLEFLTIAAHLDPNNRDQWIRIADMYIERKKYDEARICYSKAIKFFPKDYEIRLMKSKLYNMMGRERNEMLTLLRMIAKIPSEKYEYCLQTAKNVANFFYNIQKMNFALEAMMNAYKVAGKHFTSEDINLLLELLIINKSYHTVLVILKNCEMLEYDKENPNNKEIFIIACVLSDNMPSEYRIKAYVSLIHLKAYHLIDYIINNIFEFIPLDTHIEGYIDVAEAMMHEGKYLEALSFLELILNNDNNIQIPPYIWLRYAECHCSLGNNLEAIKSYQKVVELAPFCYDAKFSLSALLKKQGKYNDALKALEQDLDTDTFNPKILYEYCLMLKSVNEIDQYIEGGYVLLARNSLKFRNREEMLQASAGANYYKQSTIKSIVEGRLDTYKKDDDILDFKDNEMNISIDDEYNLFKDLLNVCHDKKKFAMMQKLCFAIITSKKFRTKFKELEKLIIITSLYNDDTLIAFMFLREILSRNSHKKNYYNIANLLIQKYDSVRYYRYFKRLLDRTTTESYFKIFLANYHLSAGSYKYALNLYVSIFKDTNDPLLALCITVVFSQMSTQKNSLKRQTSAAQAIAFAQKYSELRLLSTLPVIATTSSTKITSPVAEQEVYYNLGRIYHHVGLPHYAIKYYTKALNIENEFIQKHENILGLREEIAYNLHLIYKSHGNYDMARKCLYKYISI